MIPREQSPTLNNKSSCEQNRQIKIDVSGYDGSNLRNALRWRQQCAVNPKRNYCSSDAVIFSSSKVFCRVNRHRRCLICGKPDWCSFELRDHVYNQLIRLSPAARYRDILILGEKSLPARGLKEDQFPNYGGLPSAWRDREKLVAEINRSIGAQFPADVPLLGAPGFWQDDRGVHLWKEIDYFAPRLLIPVRDGFGQIQAFQMRRPNATEKRLRYCWLSSLGLPLGAGSGSPLHFTFRLTGLGRDEMIVIVEGILKADVLCALRPEMRIIATAGVSSGHDALIELTKGRMVIIAFDQDYLINEAVCLRLGSLIGRRLQSEMTLKTTRIATWEPTVKGIDDAVHLGLPINSISVRRWVAGLNEDLQRKVWRLIRGYGINDRR